MKVTNRSDLSEVMSVLSVINLLPSNEAELQSFKSKLRNEVLVSPDVLGVLKQLHWCLRTITEIMEDPQLKRRFFLEACCYGEEFFQHHKTNYQVDIDTEEIIIEL